MKNPKDLYSDCGIYGNFHYGSPSINRGIRCAHHLCSFHKKRGEMKVLCFGSGNGYEVVRFLKKGNSAYSVDFYQPNVGILKGRQIKANGNSLPFKDKSFDLFFSCETMEHVEEEWVDDILKEARRISDEVFFTIADADDKPYSTHICIHELPWWLEKFESLGFKIINAQKNARLGVVSDGGSFSTFGWPDGSLIYAQC